MGRSSVCPQLLLLLALAGAARGQSSTEGIGPPAGGPEDPWGKYPRVAQEALVHFRAGATPAQRGAALGRGGGVEAEVVVGAAPGRGPLVRVTFAAAEGLATAQAARQVAADPWVQLVEPNYIHTPTQTSNDPLYTAGDLWGMYGDASPLHQNEFGSRAAQAWAMGKTGVDGAEVWVGVIDEGVMLGHEDLAANVGRVPLEIPGNGIDDDGNGYVDDVHGWDFEANDASVFDGLSDDHGTHVAGTIGAAGGNGRGVAGVAWKLKLLSAKFMGRNGGTTANAVRAVDYFTDLKQRHGLNLVATSNSWGGGGFSQALSDAIERASAANILFIASAGNDFSNNDAVPYYPASYPHANVISVAALTPTGALYPYSNYGAGSVHLAAPGTDIVSTVPAGKSNTRPQSGYAAKSGTSMAAPHVTGAAALYASYNPGASAAQIKAAILQSAAPTASVAGRCITGGRLDVARLLNIPDVATG